MWLIVKGEEKHEKNNPGNNTFLFILENGDCCDVDADDGKD